MLNFDPQLWPHPTPGGHDFHKLEFTLPEDASTQVSAFLVLWFMRRRFLKIYPIYSYVKLRPPIVAPPYPRGSWFSQRWIYTTWSCFHTSLSFPGWLVSEKKIFKDLLNIFLCKTSIPHCSPTLPPGVMLFTTLNLHYLRMHPQKCQLSWLISFWEEDF